MHKFKVYWKGEFVGEFDAGELRNEVARGTIGHLHGVRLKSGKFISVGDLLQKLDNSAEEFDFEAEFAKENGTAGEFEFAIFGYALAGLSFLSMASMAGSFIYCIFLAKSGRGKLAAQIFLLSLIIGLLGLFFNGVILSSM